MMQTDIRTALKAWGDATVNRWCYSCGDRSIHVLEQARDLAPGTQENALRALVGRDGGDRRRLMAAAIPWSGEKRRMDIVPMWACDPVPASNDASPPRDLPETAVDTGIPEHLLWVERAVAQLGRQYPLRGLVVRTEYTFVGSQAVKAHVVEDLYGGRLTLRQYRAELAKSWEWFAGRVAA